MRTKKIIIFAFIVLLWLVADQIAKAQALYELGSGIVITVIPQVLSLQLAFNTGGAFSVFEGSSYLLAAICVLVCIAILIYIFKTLRTISYLGIVSLALVFAGGLGNLIDRICHGYVLDFLKVDLIDFPIFNIADIGVTIGVVLFIISLMLSADKATNQTSEA